MSRSRSSHSFSPRCAVVCAVIGIALVAGCGVKRANSKGGWSQNGPAAVPVEAVVLGPGVIVTEIEGEGHLESEFHAPVLAPASRIVRNVLVTDGEEVTFGQPLIQLDDRDEQHAVVLAEAAVQAARDRLETAKRIVADRGRAVGHRRISRSNGARARGQQ